MATPDNPPGPDVTNDDESARVDIAVRALGDMRSRASGEGRDTLRSSKSGERDDSQQSVASSRDFVARMSSIPLVGTAIWAYEQGKASSKVVKYGAQMVESSVKSISKPVMNRLPVNQIDEFACRQLDKLDKYRRPSVGPEPISPKSPVSPSRSHLSSSTRMSDANDAGSSSTSIEPETDRGRSRLVTKTFDGSPAPENEARSLNSRKGDQNSSAERRTSVENNRSVPDWIDSTASSTRKSESETASPMDESDISAPISIEDRRPRSPLGIRTPDQQAPHPRQRPPGNDRQTPQNQNHNADRQVVQRSRWQAMLLEAGGLGVALSDENMRRLKYCLNWLLYATAHIDAQILILRDFMESIQPIRRPNSNTHRRPPISEEQLRKLTEVRKDIVSTVRQMVDVVSKYAGGALPEPARGRVRGFILKLPHRWASRAAAAGVGAGVVANPASGPGGGERERETVAAAGSSTGVLRRGQGRDKRAAQRERGTSSRAPSPTPLDASHSSQPNHSGPNTNQHLSHNNATAAAQRILSLATESLDMMRNVTGVVKDSLDRADAWVNRLRMVGVQRGNQNAVNDDALNEEFGPPRIGSQYDASPTSRDNYRALFQTHRRGGSTSSVSAEDETSFSGSTPASPYATTASLGYLSNSSYTAASSMPSTPTGNSFASPPIPHATLRDLVGGPVSNAPSPGAIPFASMHITSRFNTPKSSVVGLPMEDDELESGPDEPSSLRRSNLPMEVDS